METIAGRPPDHNPATYIVGIRGCGKTPLIVGDKQYGIVGFTDIYPSQRNMGVIIVLTTDHVKYRHIPLLRPADIKPNMKGVHKIIVKAEDIIRLIPILQRKCWGCALVFDDAHEWLFGIPIIFPRRLISSAKNQNVDPYFVSHDWPQIRDEICGYVNYWEIYKTASHPDCKKKFMKSYYPRLIAVYDRVQANPNFHYHEQFETGI